MLARLRIGGASLMVVVAMSLLAAPSAAASSPSVPFVLRITGVGGFSSPSAVFFMGSGTATHMGAVSDVGAATDFTPATACPFGGINNQHAETFTAADGSTLSVLSQDVACWAGPAVVVCADCQWWVVGGTGRFEDADGSGTLDGYLDVANGTFAGTYTGTISY